MSLRIILAASAVLFAPAVLFPVSAQAEPPVYTGALDDIAVQGYDPVAYFSAGRPVKGSSDFTYDYMGATFRFSSKANRDAFAKSPASYAPQYGGYCAWAVSQGYHAKGDARFWKIVEGKLYLNYNSSVQKKWEADVPGFIRAANTNWPQINK